MTSDTFFSQAVNLTAGERDRAARIEREIVALGWIVMQVKLGIISLPLGGSRIETKLRATM